MPVLRSIDCVVEKMRSKDKVGVMLIDKRLFTRCLRWGMSRAFEMGHVKVETLMMIVKVAE